MIHTVMSVLCHTSKKLKLWNNYWLPIIISIINDVIMRNVFVLMDGTNGRCIFYLYCRLLGIYLKANTMIIIFRVTIVIDFQVNTFPNLWTSLLFLIPLQWPSSFSGHECVSFSCFTTSITYKKVFWTYKLLPFNPSWQPTLSLDITINPHM